MINENHITFLSRKDKILKKIIEQNEKPQISKSKDYVLDLCKYIIFQQISTKAGISIFNRFIDYYNANQNNCLLYTSPSPRDLYRSRMPSSA